MALQHIVLEQGKDILDLTAGGLGLAAADEPIMTSIDIWDVLAQAGAVASDVISSLNPENIVATGVAFLASGAAEFTGIRKYGQDLDDFISKSSGGTFPSEEALGVAGDAVTVVSDFLGMFAPLAIHLPTLKEFLSVASVGLTITGAVISGLQLEPTVLSNIESTLVDTMGTLQSTISKFSSAGIALFGTAWSSTADAMTAALAAVSNLITSTAASKIDDFISAADAASSAFAAADTALFALFGLSGSAPQSMTESGTNGTTSIATADGSITGTGSLNLDAENGSAYSSSSATDTSTKTTITGADILAPSGTATLSTSAQSGSNSASQSFQTDSSGSITQQQTILDGITIVSPVTQPAEISVAPDGSLQMDVLSSTAGHQVTLQAASDGSGQLIFGTDSSNPQQIVEYASGGLVGDRIGISEAGGSTIVTTKIGSGNTSIVLSDNSVSGVVQNFRFDAPNGTLQLAAPSAFAGTIANFLQGDTIDLVGIGLATSAVLGFGNVLDVRESDGSSISLQLDPSQSFAGLVFNTELDSSGGTNVTVSTAAAVLGTQAVTADAPVDPNTGNPYSANVSFTPTDIRFPAFRTNDPLPSPAQIAATFQGGNLDPDSGADVVINQLYPNPSAFYLQAGFNVGPLNTSGTGEIALQANPAGDYSEQTLPLDVSYGGGTTELDLTVSTKIYAPAVPQFDIGGVQTLALDFGTIHLGETVSKSVDIANVATGNLTDDLSSTPGTLGQFAAENGFSNVPAGRSATVTVDMTGEIPGPTLVLDSGPLFGLTSHDSDLPDAGVEPLSTPFLRGTVNYYANPIFSNSTVGATVGTLTQNGSNWTLDLGTVALGSYGDEASIEIVNAAPSVRYSDTLTGTAEVSAPADGGFIQAFSDLTGQMAFGSGGFLALAVFQPYGDVLGTHSETITFHPTSSNSSGFTASLPDETITIVDEVQAPCYVGGTHIATPEGDVRVEELAIGDRVCVRFAGQAAITWIGHRQVDCRRHPEPRKVWPVRVRAGALQDGMPHRDLWLSPDHAVFFDGVLIPIRLLLNGATIVQEPVEQVTYFHVELARHDVLLAEGVPAESYLDTGNRAMFAEGGVAMMLHPDFATVNAGLKSWERDACAPLAVRPDQVEPLWKRLARRAQALGCPVPETSVATDPRLRLEAGGRELRPLPSRNGWQVFVLPPGSGAVRLVSRAVVPSDVRPWLEDRRRLGVAVGCIRARVGAGLAEIPLDHPSLRAGWHGVEREGERLWRWTDGDARLSIPAGATMLEIQLAASAEYPVEVSVGVAARSGLRACYVTSARHPHTASALRTT